MRTISDDSALREVRASPPDAFVVDLARAPSRGLALGVWLRQQKPTRAVPIVFVDGEPEKRSRVRAVLPDATYTEWRNIRGGVPRALRAAPAPPLVPGVFAPYAGRPLATRLGVRARSRVALLGAPRGFDRTLGSLPEGARLVRTGAQVGILFARDGRDLERRFAAATRALADRGALWIAWPKATSALAGDLTQQRVRPCGLARGWVDYKICAIDETWSALCFTRRRAT